MKKHFAFDPPLEVTQFGNLEKNISVEVFTKTDLSNSVKKVDLFAIEDEILGLFTSETLEVLLEKRNIKKH